MDDILLTPEQGQRLENFREACKELDQRSRAMGYTGDEGAQGPAGEIVVATASVNNFLYVHEVISPEETMEALELGERLLALANKLLR
jgi:hypothetical protein